LLKKGILRTLRTIKYTLISVNPFIPMKILRLILLLCLPSALMAQDYKEVDAFARSVAFSKDYEAKAKELAAPYETETEQVRAIFTWIAHHIRYDKGQARGFEPGQGELVRADSEAELERLEQARIAEKLDRMLRKRKGVCQDYSWLLEAMLETIGIESAFVSGYSRTSPEQMGRTPRQPAHAWSAIRIDGDWQLFDLTWSTDMEEFGSNGFFMMPPEEFLKSHYPSEEKWQLIDDPITLEEWSDRAYWHKSYNRYPVSDLRVNGEPHQHYVIPYESELSLTGELQPGQKLYAIKGNGEKRVELTRSGEVYTVDLEANRLRGTVTIGVLGEGRFSGLVTFKVRS
jgi:hypothetical protein